MININPQGKNRVMPAVPFPHPLQEGKKRRKHQMVMSRNFTNAPLPGSRSSPELGIGHLFQYIERRFASRIHQVEISGNYIIRLHCRNRVVFSTENSKLHFYPLWHGNTQEKTEACNQHPVEELIKNKQYFPYFHQRRSIPHHEVPARNEDQSQHCCCSKSVMPGCMF